MQRVGADVLPEAVEAVLLGGGAGTRHLEDARGDLERGVGDHDLEGGDGLGDLAALGLGQVAAGAEGGGELGADLVGQGLDGLQLGVVAAVLGDDVVLVGGLLLRVEGEGPGAGLGEGVALGGLEGAVGDAQVEVGEDGLDGRGEDGGEGDVVDGLVGDLAGEVPAQAVLPGDGDVVDAGGAGLGQAHAHGVPVVGEDEAGLVGLDDGEDVVLGALEHALEDDQVGEGGAGGEVLEAVEDEAVARGGDARVVVARVDGGAAEVVVLDDELLVALALLLGAEDAGGGGPHEVVAQDHTDRPAPVSTSMVTPYNVRRPRTRRRRRPRGCT